MPTTASTESPEILIQGVQCIPLSPHPDNRGCFTELYRQSWVDGIEFIEWSLLRSVAGSIRGVHVHPRHHDALIVVSGEMELGIYDVREGSPTRDVSQLLTLNGREPNLLILPPGVAHGFYTIEESLAVLGMSEYFASDDWIGCRWDDPNLALPWSLRVAPSEINQRDQSAGNLEQMSRQWNSRYSK